jgi:competence protein ComEA
VARRVRSILGDGEPAVADVGAGSETHGAWVPGEDFLTYPRPTPEAAAPDVPDVVRHHRSSLAERVAARLPVRVDPGPRGAVAIGVAVLVAAVVTGGWVLSSRPHAVAVTSSAPVPDPVISAGTRAAPTQPSVAVVPSGTASVSSGPMLVVDVAGKVRHPGLYHLPSGARVDDALHAAGGALRGVDLTSLNLAAKVADGQQVVVGVPGPAPGAGSTGGGPASNGTAATSGPVDLNSATLEQLETLPGVGPVLGQHILDWRTAHGRFDTIDQLREVSGIGDVKFAALRGQVTV